MAKISMQKAENLDNYVNYNSFLIPCVKYDILIWHVDQKTVSNASFSYDYCACMQHNFSPTKATT